MLFLSACTSTVIVPYKSKGTPNGTDQHDSQNFHFARFQLAIKECTKEYQQTADSNIPRCRTPPRLGRTRSAQLET